MIRYINLLAIFSILLAGYSCRKGDDLIPDDANIIKDDGNGTGTVTWTKDMEIILKGYVFVNEGQTLTIEAGTVVKFETGQGAAASTLIVANGGKIEALGTADKPIIFTSVLDNGSLPKDTSGLWGGLIILGNAPINSKTGEEFIEGIPISEARGLFGGNNENDNSGTLEYVSIRYAGTFLHEENEINGLTLGGVGNGTQISNVEVINSADDGIEVFGGTVNLKNIISVNAHDDAFDYDMGYKGKVQYLLAIQTNNIGDNLIEGSGTSSTVSIPSLSLPVFANITLVGNGKSNGHAIYLDKSSGAYIVNSIITNKSEGAYNEYSDGQIGGYSQWERGNLKIECNLFYNVANNLNDSIFKLYSTGSSIPANAILQWKNYFSVGKNLKEDPKFNTGSSTFAYIPGIATNTNLFDMSTLDTWFDNAQHKGAFLNTDWSAWAFYHQLIE